MSAHSHLTDSLARNRQARITLKREMRIRPTRHEDIPTILTMYQGVAAIPGGLARLEREVSLEYVTAFVEKSLTDGVSLVAVERDGEIIGELHAYSPGLFCFSHLLGDLTVAVDPDFRAQGVARALFEVFFAEIERHLPHIRRVELIARESNEIAVRFYESLGFRREGRLEGRIRNLDGSLEADIPMGWTRGGG